MAALPLSLCVLALACLGACRQGIAPAGPDDPAPLIETLRAAPQARARAEAAQRLAARSGPPPEPVLAALTAALDDRDAGVRLCSAQSLWVLLDARTLPVVPVLEAALGDPAREIRWRAAFLLGRLGSRARPSVPALLATLRDPDPQVRDSAAEALAAIGAR